MRWKLVGNAVTVGVSEWVARRMAQPGTPDVEYWPWESQRWPTAAWGENGKVRSVEVSEFPEHAPYRHLLDVVELDATEPLSERAVRGFWSRLQQGNLGRHPGFRRDLASYVASFGEDIRPAG